MANLLSTTVNGNLITSGGYTTSNYNRILYPSGGSYVTTTSVITGAIRIKLPTQGSAMMMTCTVKVYEYNANKSFTITFGGHRDSNNWYNVFCYLDGDSARGNLTVRFGVDDGKDCVWIGDTSNQWSHPQVFVTDVQLGYTGYNQTWASGWSVDFVTSFATINRTETAYAKITNANIGSQSVNYASSAGNADTVDGKHATNNASNLAVYESNGYLYIPSWMNVNGGGIFSSTNNAHLRPNTSSYGAWEMIGSKNGWSGIFFNDSSNTLMANGDESGFYRIGDGWQFRWYRGEMYISSGSAGGGTERTVIHSGNISSQSVNYATSSGNSTTTSQRDFNYLSTRQINQGSFQSYHVGTFSAAGTQARRFLIGKIGIDYNDWNGVGLFEVEIAEQYFYSGQRKRYVVNYGYGSVNSIHLVESNGIGSNNADVVIDGPTQISGDHYVLSVYVRVKYYGTYTCRVRTTRSVTTSNPPGQGQVTIFTDSSAENISDFSVDSTVYPTSATSGIAAPVFYDSDDTGYYLDPNGTSNLNKFSEMTMAFNGMNPRSANSPYSQRYNGSVGYRNGTMGYGTTDFNTIARNWGSGFIDTWTNPGNAPGGSSHYIGLQGVHYSDGGSSFYGFQMACAGEADNRFFWRSSWPNMRSWVEMIHSGNIGTQSVSYASSAGNADTVDNYHASGLLRSDGGNWNPGANITLYQTGNGQEWSFDIYRQGYTGGYWHVWDSSHGTMLGVDATNNYVWATGSFRAPIFYDSADTNYYLDPNSYSRIYRTSTHIAPSPGVGSSNWVTDFENTPVTSMSFGGDLSSGGPRGTWWFQQNFRHGNSSSTWGTQIAWGWEDNSKELWQRNVSAGSYSNWTRYLNTDNHQSVLPSYYMSIPAWTSGTQSAVRSSFVASGRWYRIANLGTERFFARVRIYDNSSGGPHSSVEFQVSGAFNNLAGYSFVQTSNGYYSAASVTQVRILYAGTYDPQYLEVYINYVGDSGSAFAVSLLEARNATVVNWNDGEIPSGYSRIVWDANGPLAVGGRSAVFNDGIRSATIYDIDDSAYYLNPNGTSVLKGFDLNTTGTAKFRYLVPGEGTVSINAPFAFNSSYGAINIAMTDNDTGGVVIDNEGVTVYGAGDTGAVFRVIDEDVWQTNGNNVDAATTFRVIQGADGGALTRGTHTATNDFRAPIFYDSQDTSYYVDPNSASQLSSVYANNWFRPQGGTGLYFQTYGYGIYSADSGGSPYGNVATYTDGASSWPGYAIKNYACFMARDIRRGIFIPTQDTWLIRWESSDNMAHVDFELQWGSDIRHKSNIKRLTNSLDKVKQLKGVSYNYKGNERTSIGFIAQEVEPILPEVVSTDGDGFKSVGYANIVALLSEAIKEQQAMIEELKARIDVLESK